MTDFVDFPFLAFCTYTYIYTCTCVSVSHGHVGNWPWGCGYGLATGLIRAVGRIQEFRMIGSVPMPMYIPVFGPARRVLMCEPPFACHQKAIWTSHTPDPCILNIGFCRIREFRRIDSVTSPM